MKENDEKIEQLEQKLCSLKQENRSLGRRIDDLENENHQNTIILSGDAVPPGTATGKNCSNVVSNLMRDRLKIMLLADSILTAYRIGAKPANQSPDRRRIVAKLSHREQRRDILKACRMSKPPGLFINESLTPTCSELLFSIRQIKRQYPNRIAACGSLNGRIFAWRLAALSEEYELTDLPVMRIMSQNEPMWLIPPISCNDINPPKKLETNSLLMKQLFYHHVYEKHRNSNHIFTDGSKTTNGVGCAVLYRNHTYSKKLSNCTGIYNAELRAILKAVQLAKADQIATSTVIFTDSQSVRDSMQKRNTDHPLICKIFHLILQMFSEGKRVEICWVPAHVGITQNERADQGAREAAAADSPITTTEYTIKITILS